MNKYINLPNRWSIEIEESAVNGVILMNNGVVSVRTQTIDEAVAWMLRRLSPWELEQWFVAKIESGEI